MLSQWDELCIWAGWTLGCSRLIPKTDIVNNMGQKILSWCLSRTVTCGLEINKAELWIMSNNPCNRATLIFIYDYLIMVLESRTTKTTKGRMRRMIDEWLTVKAVKDKGHGLYLEDSRKAMQVGSITPWTSLGQTLKKSWQGIIIYSNRYFHRRNKTGTIITCRTILPYSTQLNDPSLTLVLVSNALHSGGWIHSILHTMNGCHSSQCNSFVLEKKTSIST